MSDILGCNSMGLKLSIRGEVITERWGGETLTQRKHTNNAVSVSLPICLSGYVDSNPPLQTNTDFDQPEIVGKISQLSFGVLSAQHTCSKMLRACKSHVA